MWKHSLLQKLCVTLHDRIGQYCIHVVGEGGTGKSGKPFVGHSESLSSRLFTFPQFRYRKLIFMKKKILTGFDLLDFLNHFFIMTFSEVYTFSILVIRI